MDNALSVTKILSLFYRCETVSEVSEVTCLGSLRKTAFEPEIKLTSSETHSSPVYTGLYNLLS